MSAGDRLARVLAVHFDPRWGAAYWLDRARALGFDPRREIHRIDELDRLGPMDLDALAERPIRDFVPRSLHDQLPRFVSCETGGTLGPPGRTAFRDDEFEAAFVAPFCAAADRVGFPRDRDWLYVGPSGPHPVGKAARRCAVALGSIDPLSVDFDPRWARRLPPESMARRRYLAHVLDQALAVLRTERVGVLFSTPPVLEALGERLDPARRDEIEGIHLGGMAAGASFYQRLGRRFPRAVLLSGYGNSLAGMCPQLDRPAGSVPPYFPHGDRLVLGVRADRPGARGRVWFHRLDESTFLPNVLERDEAAAVAAPADAAPLGFTGPGVAEPGPPAASAAALGGGLY